MTIKADELLDREQIKESIYTYCHGVDRENWAKVKALFVPDAGFTFGPFDGSIDEFIGFGTDTIAQMDGTLHTIGNILIDFSSGSEANSEAAFVAYHRIMAGTKGPIPSEAHDVDWIVAGRYVDQWRKSQQGWKIVQRTGHLDWVRRDRANAKQSINAP